MSISSDARPRDHPTRWKTPAGITTACGLALKGRGSNKRSARSTFVNAGEVDEANADELKLRIVGYLPNRNAREQTLQRQEWATSAPRYPRRPTAASSQCRSLPRNGVHRKGGIAARRSSWVALLRTAARRDRRNSLPHPRQASLGSEPVCFAEAITWPLSRRSGAGSRVKSESTPLLREAPRQPLDSVCGMSGFTREPNVRISARRAAHRLDDGSLSYPLMRATPESERVWAGLRCFAGVMCWIRIGGAVWSRTARTIRRSVEKQVAALPLNAVKQPPRRCCAGLGVEHESRRP